MESIEMDRTIPHIVVTGYVKVAPKDSEAFVKMLQAHVPRVRKKDGCIAYAFAADVLDPDVVRMSEAWRDQESLEAHLADKEFQGVLEELAHIGLIARSVQRYDVSSSTEI
jgi:quinol monooxygenase YgiN